MLYEYLQLDVSVVLRMEYRLDKKALFEVLGQWNSFLKRKIHLVACGGTAMTLLDVKPSTKDVDFMVPVAAEYRYLVKTLRELGYEQSTGAGWRRKGDLFDFDLFAENRIHTTELLENPLNEGNHTLLKEFSRLYIGVLNEYDLIASKLFRGTEVDFADCLMLVRAKISGMNIEYLKSHYLELAGYDVSEERLVRNLDYFLDRMRQEGIYG